MDTGLDLMLMGEDEILEEVDEYLLYCFYLGFQPEMRVRYKSMIREEGNEDTNASWSMFTNTSRLTREYAWKDSGTGEYGDIFKLVQLILKFKNKAMVIERIKSDFITGNGVEMTRNISSRPVNTEPSHIRIKSKDFDATDLQWWFERTGAMADDLRYFNVRRVKYYWMRESQISPSFPGDRVYSYRIYDHYQLYFPQRDRDFRFRNDFNDLHLPGFCQLKYESDTLIITKSMKDIIAMYKLGFEAVSPRGEHTMIPAQFLEIFKNRYKNIFILFDNDGKHHGWNYPFPSIEVPICSGQKDISDFRLAYGHERSLQLIHSLINNHPAMKDLKDLDLTKPRSRKELEFLLEPVYLNRIIKIQHVGKKVREVCGKVHRISVDFQGQEPICITIINDLRYEFALGYFIQKAQILEYGDTHTAGEHR